MTPWCGYMAWMTHTYDTMMWENDVDDTQMTVMWKNEVEPRTQMMILMSFLTIFFLHDHSDSEST